MVDGSLINRLTGLIKKHMGDARGFFIAIGIFLTVPGLAYLFLLTEWGVIRESQQAGSLRPAVAVADWLERLPTETAFFFFVAALAGAYMGRRWWLSAYLVKEIKTRKESEDKSTLSPRDWWVVEELRRRAFTFRTLATLLLVGVIALLFGVVYLVLFVLPQVPVRDRFLSQEVQQRANFKAQFDHRLQHIGQGRYWFKAVDLSLQDGDVSDGVRFHLDLFRLIPHIGTIRPRLSVLNKNIPLKEEFSILAIGPRSVSISIDGGQNWSTLQDLKLKENEWIVTAIFDETSTHGVIGGDGGSVFFTSNGGKNWSAPQGLELKESEGIAAAVFDETGTHGVIGGVEGSVFVTSDGGQSWNAPQGLKLKENERIVTAVLDETGTHGVIGGVEGSVFITSDGGKNWSVPQKLSLKENKNERIVTVVFNKTGTHGVVVGAEGSVFVTKDGVKNWGIPQGLKFKESERIVTAVFDKAGKHGLVGGAEGSVYVTSDGGKSWSAPQGLKLKENEMIVTAVFDETGTHGVAGGAEGSVYVTRDGGENWSAPQGLKLKENKNEWIEAAVFNETGTHGVVGGDEGSVFVTTDGGKNWDSTEWDSGGSYIVDVVSAAPNSQEYVAVDADGVVYLLKAYPDIAEWENLPMIEVRNLVQRDKIISKSAIGEEIINFFKDSAISINVSGGGEGKNSGFMDEITAMRIVTLVILFFLVHVLVRLHQYSLRLATFWDSRADAVLLAKSFACRSSESFDDLVAALAPDSYDFKPLPKSRHETVTAFTDQMQTRGGSRRP